MLDQSLTRLKLAVSSGLRPSSDFDLNPEIKLPADRKLRPAGVLIAVDQSGGVPAVILTKRASGLKHHPGQIAFPGGKVDAVDEGSAIRAALREAHEEIGLPMGAAEVIGTLPNHETVTSFTVTPVLSLVTTAFDPVPEAGEVEEVFTVPLSHVLEPANFIVEHRIWRGQRRYFYTVPYGPYYIWGATARILRGLADSVAGA